MIQLDTSVRLRGDIKVALEPCNEIRDGPINGRWDYAIEVAGYVHMDIIISYTVPNVVWRVRISDSIRGMFSPLRMASTIASKGPAARRLCLEAFPALDIGLKESLMRTADYVLSSKTQK